MKTPFCPSGSLTPWTILPALALIASAAHGQVAGALEEIVVTAQKRSENVQQVPIAITAISADALQQKGITSVAQLSDVAPNVNLDAGTPFSGSDTVLSAYIRGIGQDDFAFNLDPGVGVYVDGVYLARSVGANTTMLDVDRVEILKGPQGTLFGRNSIGGAISIVTRDPGKEFKAKGELTSGSFNRLDAKVTFDVPFSDTVLSTVSFTSEKRDGYQRRIPYVQTNVNGSAGIPDCTTATCPYITDAAQQFPAAGYQSSATEGGINKWSTRAKLVWLASDDVKFTVAADYLHVDQSASPNTVIGIGGIPNGLAGISNLCMLGNQSPVPVTIAFNQLCTSTRGGLSPTPTPMPISAPLFGTNADGNPYNNYLPYDSRFQTNNIDTTYSTGNSFSKLKNWGAGTTLDWGLGNGMSLRWINAYREMQWDVGMDLDGSPENVLQTSFDMPQHQISEELQLNGKAVDNRLDYAVGAYYFREAGHLHDYVTFPMGILMVDGPNDLETRAEALYAHLNFKVNDLLGFTAGARYTKERKQFQGHQTDDNGLTYKISGCNPPSDPANLHFSPAIPPFVTCQNALGFPVPGNPYTYYPIGPFVTDYTNTSPTVGFDLHFTKDVMLYGTFSKGYKTGSWTTRLSAPHPVYLDEKADRSLCDPVNAPAGCVKSSLQFDPEFAKSFELGLKSELAEHRLRLNLAGFHTKYDNIQLNSQIGISPTIVNAGDASIYGFELEAQAVVGNGFSLTAALGYTHAKYDTLNNVLDNGYQLTLNACPERKSDPTSVCDLPKTPKFKGYLGPQYVFELPNQGQLQLNADYTYVTKEYNDIGNTEELARPALSLINAEVTYKAPGGSWELVVGGSNLGDKRYIVSGQNQGGVSVIDASYNRPREWFVTLRFTPGASK